MDLRPACCPWLQALEDELAAARAEAAELASLHDQVASSHKNAGVLQASAWLTALPLVQLMYFTRRLLWWLAAVLENVRMIRFRG